MEKYRLGLVSVSFRQNTPEEIVEAVKDSGLSFIEWGSDVHAPCQNPDRLREISGLQREYNIKCSSYGTYFRLGQTPIDCLEDHIAAARVLGTDILRLWCGVKSGENYTEEEKNYLFEQCGIAEKMARDAGVTLCTECHAGTFTERLDDALLLMRKINSPHFRSYWQPFQTKTTDDNLIYAERIAPYAEHIHVFQWKGSERFPLDSGIDEWRAYLAKFDTTRTLLLEFMPDDNISTLKREAEALKTIVGETV